MKIKSYSTSQNKYVNQYVNFLKKYLNLARPLKVVFDCSNGSVGPIIKKLITNPGSRNKFHYGVGNRQLTTFLINERPDGNFPAHSPNPLDRGARNQLIKEVKRKKADLGVIFDADGDRAFFVDRVGRPVDQDVILRLLAWHLNPKKIVVTEDAGWLVAKKGNVNAKIIFSKIGRHFVRSVIKKHNAELAMERSGHFYFKDFFHWDSGLFAAINVINAVSRLPYGLDHFMDFLPRYYRLREINFEIKKTSVKVLFQRLEGLFKSEKGAKVLHFDGLKMEFHSPDSGWWFSFRQSNTANFLFRLDMEAERKEALDKNQKKITAFLKKFG